MPIHEELLGKLPPAAAVLGARGLADIEAETEGELARPWQPGLDLLEARRERAKFVGFVSDMYLPPDTVRRILVAAGAWREGDSLYVSCEEQATKASGRLFQALAGRHGITPERWVHFGDNPEADVAVPRRLGMRSMSVRRPAAARRSRAADAVRRLVAEGIAPTRQEVTDLLRGFLERPSAEEVAAIGNWPTQDLQGADAAAPLVAQVAWGALLRACLTGRVPRIGHWNAGARVINGAARHFAYRALRRVYRRTHR